LPGNAGGLSALPGATATNNACAADVDPASRRSSHL